MGLSRLDALVTGVIYSYEPSTSDPIQSATQNGKDDERPIFSSIDVKLSWDYDHRFRTFLIISTPQHLRKCFSISRCGISKDRNQIDLKRSILKVEVSMIPSQMPIESTFLRILTVGTDCTMLHWPLLRLPILCVFGLDWYLLALFYMPEHHIMSPICWLDFHL